MRLHVCVWVRPVARMIGGRLRGREPHVRHKAAGLCSAARRCGVRGHWRRTAQQPAKGGPVRIGMLPLGHNSTRMTCRSSRPSDADYAKLD